MAGKIGVGAVFLVIVIAAVMLYGSARHEQGKLEGINECNAEAVRSSTEALRDLERIELETSRLSDSDIDNDLRALGILRADEDR